MKKGKYANNKRSRRGATSKTLMLMLSLALIVGCVAGGTLAWLTANTTEVKNTFTESDIGVKLKETTTDYKMIPGWTIAKDPKAWIEAGSEDSILFVKVEKSDNFDSFMEFEIADGWKLVDGETNVYYREIEGDAAKGENAALSILKDDQVKVKGEVTKEMMDALTEATRPTLTFTAYAHQLYENKDNKFDAADAWENLNPKTTTTPETP